jgi:hypothetical protein
MNLNAFKPFFSFIEPSWSPKFTYGLTHFYNKVRSSIDWDSYSVIKPATEECGEVLLGQIPVKSFQAPLIKKLSGNGLVVSCNDNFELAGIGAFCNIIPPHSWTYYSVDHQHLPFTDYASNADPSLIIMTLEKMVHAHTMGESVFIHCKAGRSRSALVAALFLCITDESKKNQLLRAENNQQIEDVLTNTIDFLKTVRPQVSVDRAKLNLGRSLLKQYIQYWQGVHPESFLFNVPVQEENKLSAYQALTIISQSDEYKFVWDQAYKNLAIFPTVKAFAENIYKYIETNQDKNFHIDQLISLVMLDMKEDEVLIVKNLHDTYLAKEEYIRLLKNYPTAIQDLGLDLLDKILKSKLSYPEKTMWITKTSAYLKEPSAEQFARYNKQIDSALAHPSLPLQIIGGTMMLLGAAIIMVAVVGGFLASGGFLGITLGTIGAASFGAFQGAIGKLVYDHGTSSKIALASHTLINKVVEDSSHNRDSGNNSPCCP